MTTVTEKQQDKITYSEVNKDKESVATDQGQNAKDKNQKVITHPKDVAALVMAQLNNVNNKKDDLTIAIKALADTTDQLVKAYAGNVQIIQQLSQRVQDLEEKSKDK